MERREDVVPIGVIGRPHGVRGAMHIHSHMEPMEEILQHGDWLVEESAQPGAWRSRKVRAARGHGNGFVAEFADIADRDAAAALTGARLGLPRNALPALDEGQYYWVDLIGLEVVSETGEPLGVVGEMMATGANDVMLINRPVGATTPSVDARAARGTAALAIPFVTGEVVREVDLDAGRIRVAWFPEDEMHEAAAVGGHS